MTEALPTPRGGDDEIRVLTFNVHGLRAGTGRVAAVIAALRPDLVAIQEAPRTFRWRTRCAELARHSGLFVLAGGRPAAGNLLLCAARVRMVAVRAVLLTRTRGAQQRGAAAAVVEISGQRLGVVGWHGSRDGAERRVHATEVMALADGLLARGAAGLVVAGDLNATPGTTPLAPLLAHLDDAWARAPQGGDLTYPATTPAARVDAVLVSRHLDVLGCGVLDLTDPGASDHLPVLARVRIPPPASSCR